MRLSELIGVPVHLPDGARLGWVADVRFRRVSAEDAPPAYRVAGLVVTRRERIPGRPPGTGSRRGPWLADLVARRLDRDLVDVDWDDVALGTDASPAGPFATGASPAEGRLMLRPGARVRPR